MKVDTRIQLSKGEYLACQIIAYLVIFIAFAALYLSLEGGKRIIGRIRAEAKQCEECEECDEKKRNFIPVEVPEKEEIDNA